MSSRCAWIGEGFGYGVESTVLGVESRAELMVTTEVLETCDERKRKKSGLGKEEAKE